jgi:membrane protease YdiL (CAAX protease family)
VSSGRLPLFPALGGVVCAAAALLAARLSRGAPAAEGTLWLTLAGELCWAGLALLIALVSGGAWRERLGLVCGELSSAALALGAVGTLALSGALEFGLDALGLTRGSGLERVHEVAAEAARSRPGLTLLAFAVAPAIAEELLFRGALQRSLARRLGAAAVPLAAFAFGVVHLDPVHSAAAFLLGCYLGWLALLARSTWIAVASHLANNCAAALPLAFPAATALLPRPASWPVAGLWVAAAALCLWAIGRLQQGAGPASA